MSGAAFNRLGPRARAAMARAVETAIKAGRSDRGVQVARHVEYALDLVETAMILDAAEASADAFVRSEDRR